ncbi:stigma-specific STIG1-like protein 3 [Syzygium oleosum]|uniref:stigma-specific STIG1-like protein 3 n=1 Tax=Syzygium oleosum TaxID=219896 RepID=UPI0024BB84CC|nr:stigma-specific STIG1-like protein 3 [Syzygium oleosum]
MKSRNILSIFILSIVAITLVTDALSHEKTDYDPDYDEVLREFEYEPNAELSHRLALSFAPSRFLSQKRKRTHHLTCNKFPRICRAKGSPDCKKKCVNLLADRLNCGMCGKKCKYNEICCKGMCVNLSFNWKHCGGCNNRCNKGDFCLLGLCNYV